MLLVIKCIVFTKQNNKQLIEEHAKKGKFPANSISEVAATVISPVTAEQ